jgi:hypothetical protein
MEILWTFMARIHRQLWISTKGNTDVAEFYRIGGGIKEKFKHTVYPSRIWAAYFHYMLHEDQRILA